MIVKWYSQNANNNVEIFFLRNICAYPIFLGSIRPGPRPFDLSRKKKTTWKSVAAERGALVTVVVSVQVVFMSHLFWFFLGREGDWNI